MSLSLKTRTKQIPASSSTGISTPGSNIGIPQNKPPLAVNDLGITTENIPVNLSVLANDRDGNNNKLSIIGISPPQHGTVISNKNGTITYIPVKSWAGVDTLSYSVTDGQGGIATSKVVVNIKQKGENHAPTIKSQTVPLKQNNIAKIALQARDSDGDPLRFVIVSKPSHGEIAQFSSSSGTLIYSPEPNYVGRDNFKFKVNDGVADSNDAKITIKVIAVKDNNKNLQIKQVPRDQVIKLPSHQDNNNNTKQQQSEPPKDQPKTTSNDNQPSSEQQQQ
jgi:hypothetical protein